MKYSYGDLYDVTWNGMCLNNNNKFISIVLGLQLTYVLSQSSLQCLHIINNSVII